MMVRTNESFYDWCVQTERRNGENILIGWWDERRGRTNGVFDILLAKSQNSVPSKWYENAWGMKERE